MEANPIKPMPCPALLRTWPLIAALLLCFTANAQKQVLVEAGPAKPDTTTAAEEPKPYPDSITSFDQFDLPPEMITEFLHMPVNNALLYHNEFQMLHDGVYGQAQVVIKVWYIEDHILGYIIEKPFDNLNGAHVLKRKINIPVTWVCMPAVEGHEQHSVKSLAAVRESTTANHCMGWHIKLPDEYEPQIPTRLQKRAAPKPAAGDFGHAEKTSNKQSKKKHDKKAGFEQPADAPAAADSTGTAVPVKTGDQ